MKYGGGSILIVGACAPGVYHFMFVSVIAIIVAFIKKIDKEYKKIVYWFPLITFFLSIWVSGGCFRIASYLGFI